MRNPTDVLQYRLDVIYIQINDTLRDDAVSFRRRRIYGYDQASHFEFGPCPLFGAQPARDGAPGKPRYRRSACCQGMDGTSPPTLLYRWLAHLWTALRGLRQKSFH